jgi:hypothetical protein
VQTAELIDQLASEAAESRPRLALVRFSAVILAGCAASFIVMLAWLGIRPDLIAALFTTGYWIKFFYTLALAMLLFWLAERLARPAAAAARPARMLLIPLITIAAFAVAQLVEAAPQARTHLMMGASARLCPWRIIALSVPILIAAIVGMRRLAPTRPVAAGLAAGLLAGAAGAWIYAFHCDEGAAPFIAIWYTLGIAAVGALGCLSGKWMLRW